MKSMYAFSWSLSSAASFAAKKRAFDERPRLQEDKEHIYIGWCALNRMHSHADPGATKSKVPQHNNIFVLLYTYIVYMC